MNRFNTLLVGTCLSASLLAASAAQAMNIIQYDLMAAQDRQAFLNFLPQAAQTVLNQEGRSDDATKVFHLFNDIRPGDNLPVGEAELILNLDNERIRDTQKHIQNPTAPRVQVEVALAETLGKNGIQITPDFIKALMQQTGTFRP